MKIRKLEFPKWEDVRSIIDVTFFSQKTDSGSELTLRRYDSRKIELSYTVKNHSTAFVMLRDHCRYLDFSKARYAEFCNYCQTQFERWVQYNFLN